MRFFAAKGLAGDISDVWGNLTGMSDALKKASTGDDGKQYFVPSTYYPWAVFYRKSVWSRRRATRSAEDPRRAQALGAQMKKDGLVPIAFGDKDGWPAMGTFDQLNLRDQRLRLPRQPDGRQGGLDRRQGQEGLRHLGRPAAPPPARLARPHLAGGRAVAAAEEVRHVPARLVRRAAVHQGRRAGRPRLLHLPRDRLDDRHRRHRGADRRLHDGASGRRTRPAPRSCSTTSASPDAQNIAVKADPSVIATNGKADTSGYTALQKKSVEFVKSAKSIAQFLDRDTRPDFASTVMIPAHPELHQEPEGHRRPASTSIEQQKKSIFAS